MMSNQNKPRKAIYGFWAIGSLAIVTNIGQLAVWSVLNIDNGDISCGQLPFCREFIVYYFNIFFGIAYLYYGVSLNKSTAWAVKVYSIFGLWLFVPVFIIVYLIDPALVNYGFGIKR